VEAVGAVFGTEHGRGQGEASQNALRHGLRSAEWLGRRDAWMACWGSAESGWNASDDDDPASHRGDRQKGAGHPLSREILNAVSGGDL